MRKKKKNAAQNCSIETLQTKATDLLAKGRHKEAIDAYKQLLKKEQRDEWQAALAKAYLLRAQALANKDMYKEAAVLWENRANLCTDFETKIFPQTTLDSKALLDQYIYWLIRAGRHIKAVHLLTDQAEHLPEKVTWQLWSHLGALLLAGEIQDLTDVLPDDAILLKHYAIIEAALEAYYRGYLAIIEENLKQIPFRSPYRDFRPILKALLIFHSDPNGANQLLKKVPTDSPYSHFAKLIQLAGESEDKEILLEGLSKGNRYEQAFIAQLKGWDKGRMKVIFMLQTAAKRDSHKALMEVVITHRQTFGESYSRNFCMALLPSYPAGIRIYEKTYESLSAFEKNRVAALNNEQKGQLSSTAERNWRFCVENLKKKAQEENTDLKIALILRHIVELIEKRGETFDNFKIPNDLAESLAYDPDDKSSYLKLTQWYLHQNDQKNYQKWIDIAVKQFPKDGEILFLAMEAATRKKAFKKAVGFAKKLLKVDPINVKARQIAQFSHISHARKLIKSGKYSNARLELEQAAHFEKNSQRSGLVQINQGLLELQAEGFVKPKTRTRRVQGQTRLLKSPQSKPKIIKLLKEGVQLAGGVLIGQFKVIVESKSQALNPADILPLIFPQNKRTPSPTRKELLEWVNLINVYTKEGVTFLKEAVHQVKEPLQKALKLDFPQEEMLSLSQCLKNVKHYMLLKQFADNAIKHWPKHPAFSYYQIYAKVRGNVYQLSIPDAERLKDAVENAEKQGDKRTSTMIISFLNQIEKPPFFNFLDGNFDEIEDLEELLDEDMLPPPDEMRKFIERFEEMGIDLSELDEMPFPQPSSKKKKRKK
jgi:tetratricopeptide (TPR) repeat protein